MSLLNFQWEVLVKLKDYIEEGELFTSQYIAETLEIAEITHEGAVPIGGLWASKPESAQFSEREWPANLQQSVTTTSCPGVLMNKKSLTLRPSWKEFRSRGNNDAVIFCSINISASHDFCSDSCPTAPANGDQVLCPVLPLSHSGRRTLLLFLYALISFVKSFRDVPSIHKISDFGRR